MLELTFIGPECMTWISPVVLAPRKYGTYWLCVDYRRFNSVTVRDSYPLPRIEEFIDRFGDAKYIYTLEWSSEYFEIPLKKYDHYKTTFVFHSGS